MSSAVTLISGGIDSAAVLAWAHQKYSQVVALSFNYHLRPFREKLAVYRLLQTFPGRLIEVPLPFLKELADHPAASSNDEPEGYVPNRNIIFYSIAAYYAEINGYSSIVGGHLRADAEAFPDSSHSFFEKLQTLINDALLLRKVKIELPFSTLTKLDVMRKAIEWNVPLQHTWSCYWDRAIPCEKCISCTERADAFRELQLQDPLLAKS